MKILWISTMAWISVLAAMQVKIVSEIVSLSSDTAQYHNQKSNIILHVVKLSSTDSFVQHLGFIIMIYLIYCLVWVNYREITYKCF